MNYNNFWIWDIDEKICMHSLFIEDFEITNSPDGSRVYANYKGTSVIISEHSTEGEARQKIRNILIQTGN